MAAFTESEIEVFSLEELRKSGLTICPGHPSRRKTKLSNSIAEDRLPYGEPNRESYSDVILNILLPPPSNALIPPFRKSLASKL